MTTIVSRSFELRYFSSDPAADGETDFKGQTSVFDTEQRVEYLRQYARHARHFFGNPQWNRLAVTDEEVARVAAAIKPQPIPGIRRHITLRQWRRIGSKEGKRDLREARLAHWRQFSGVMVEEGTLCLTEDGAHAEVRFDGQSWRLWLEWRVKHAAGKAARCLIGHALEAGCDERGRHYYRTDGDNIDCGPAAAGQWTVYKAEIDLASSRFNLWIGDRQGADFAPWPSVEPVDSLRLEGGAGTTFGELLGIGFAPKELEENGNGGDKPFTIATFLDEPFVAHPDLQGWTTKAYDDRLWVQTDLPCVHGGERYAGERLYLRSVVETGDFARAYLNVECLDPGGEIWINGEVIAVRFDRHPGRLDVTRFLSKTEPNLLCVKVFPNEAETNMRHTSTDRHTGWFAGRMSLDLTADRHIEDVFVHCRSLHEDLAVAQVQLTLRNDRHPSTSREALDNLSFAGTVRVQWTPWFPDESETVAAEIGFPVEVEMGRSLVLSKAMRIPNPLVWTPESPCLYKVRVTLYDESGHELDESVATTGLRTVGQEGGVFRINGKPEMMNGALLFGFRYPIDKIAAWDRCSPPEWIVRDLLMLKRMNGNTARMSHHNSMVGGINDPRYAEIGDQLGILFQWATSSWVRDASPWLLDFDGLPKYVRQVRNHPSIVMWQPANHPSFAGFEAGMPWYERVYETLMKEDPSRLIAPSANLTRLKARNDDGTLDYEGRTVHPIAVWTAPNLTRGNMDGATGYGAEWSVLRKWPFPPEWEGQDGWRDPTYKADYLNSAERAYFEYENEESVGQTNWTLHGGKPEYRIKSYEWDYDRGSIGRELDFSEWEESQAWQAFSAYESIRKKRWLGYDGFAWCTLRGGGNNATYMKPLTDYYGYGKMAYYAVGMAYQKMLAGSGDVDVVYGPGDAIRPVVIHTGSACRVDLHIAVLDAERKVVAERLYADLAIPAGKTVSKLDSFQPVLPPDAYYAVEYRLLSRGD
ncbi:glycoside hydrolase family 2 protein [Paenibacillus cymbidii]|uniref:hypothetical protein n=1 Tax=Paenibacillus cymbidii TaxID=1639034 RepID=UPI00108101EC|nr:hypothetical protein [Paenibacillus cymbidii]